MVIGRGRRRKHPNQHFVLLLLNKIREKKYGKITRGKVRKKSTGIKKYGGKVREKSTGKYGEKVREKVT
jgi:hypothetical protein